METLVRLMVEYLLRFAFLSMHADLQWALIGSGLTTSI